MLIRKDSFTAADTMPLKLIQCPQAVVDGKVRPYHIQFVPTNRCNANCSWCSFNKADKKLEMEIGDIIKIIDYFKNLGTKAITITGGGEPTMHPKIREIIQYIHDNDIEVGLVTNGLLWSKKHVDMSIEDSLLTWVRVSIIDPEGKNDCNRIINFINNFPSTNVGISFTVVRNTNLKTAKRICEIANDFVNITHIRFVQNVYDIEDDSMTMVKKVCANITNKALFLWRKDFKRGAKECLVSLLKPVIDVTGYIYPCCGVQYARNEKKPEDSDWQKDIPNKFIMCYWKDFHKTEVFNGLICKKCYYDNYNKILQCMINKPIHGNFL